VFEWYASGFGETTAFYTASLAKSIVGGIALLKAVSDGALSLSDPISKFYPPWRSDPKKSKITIYHVATHTSGMEDACPAQEAQCAEWKLKYWPHRHRLAGFTIALNDATITFAPGTQFIYSNPAFSNVLAYAITASLQSTNVGDIRSLLYTDIAKPLHIPSSVWRISGGRTIKLDNYDLISIGGGCNISARAAAKLGQLMLNSGKWNGQQIISNTAVEYATTDKNNLRSKLIGEARIPVPGVGGWWLNSNDVWPVLPNDTYLGAGANHQIVLIIPSKKIVAVRFGDRLGRDSWNGDYWQALENTLLNPLMDAIDPN